MIAVVADLHIGNVSGCLDSVFGDEIIASRTVDILKRFSAMVRKLGRGDHLIIAGDVYHRARPSNIDEITFFECLNVCREREVRVTVIPGNHDCNTRDAATAVLKSARLDHVDVIHEPWVGPIGGVNMALMPHLPKPALDKIIEDHGSYSLYMAHLLRDYPQVNLLIGHAMVAGSGYENEIFFDAADAMEFHIDHFDTTGIKTAILGHIHDNSVYKSADGSRVVYYPGSIVTNNFGEIDDDKMYALIDPKDPSKVSFREFEPDETVYREVTVDLVTKDTFDPDEELVRELAEGAAIKVIVHTWDYARVDTMAIRKRFNQYGKVVKFEIRKTQSERGEVNDDSNSEAVHKEVRYDELFEDYINGSSLPKNLKKRSLELGMGLIKSGVSDD